MKNQYLEYYINNKSEIYIDSMFDFKSTAGEEETEGRKRRRNQLASDI